MAMPPCNSHRTSKETKLRLSLSAIGLLVSRWVYMQPVQADEDVDKLMHERLPARCLIHDLLAAFLGLGVAVEIIGMDIPMVVRSRVHIHLDRHQFPCNCLHQR